jgi:hypothetical protein
MYTMLPRGYTPDGDFSGTFESGKPMFRITGTKVERLCPCGLTSCKYHIIPSEMHMKGPMEYKGQDIGALFFKQPVMSRSDARKWWAKYGLVCITATDIIRTVYLNWRDICTFPTGHEMVGQVKQGEEEKALEDRFGTDVVPKYKIDGMSVVQICPCGKTECDVHVIPSTVEIDSNVPLELHLKKKVVQFERTFRSLDATSCTDIRDWFLGYPLKWVVEVTPKLVKLRMKCKCQKALDVIPCQECAAKENRECTECQRSFAKRYVKKGLCGNCRRTKTMHCAHCNEMVPLAHACNPLRDMHFSYKFGGIYPPCIRQKGSKDVICPDCNKCMKYTIFHRHQYRAHSDLLPGGGFSRAYKWHKCPYCNYKNCDITNVREHLKIHLSIRQHECRYGCGASFTRPSAENLHCRVVHSAEESDVSSLKRVGNELVTVVKKRKIHFVS